MSWSRSASCWTASALLLTCGCACDGGGLAITGESTKLRLDDPLPSESAIFDGERVALRGVRGETLGLMLTFRGSRKHRVSVDVPPEIARVQPFEVGYVQVREPSTAMYGDSRGAGLYPDVLTPVVGQVATRTSAYFDVAISPEAPAGRHHGQLAIDGRRIPVRIDVEPVSIDLDPNPLVWVFYLPREIARVHALPPGDSPELVAFERQYHALFREHGALLAADLGPERFEVRRELVRDVRYWPVAVDTSSDVAIRRDVAEWLRRFEGSDVVPFAIPVDEPASTRDKSRALHIARVIGEAGGGRPHFLRAVTDRFDPIYQGEIDLWFSPADIPARARERRPLGERFWTYNGRPPSAGSMIIDTDGVALRTWGWIAYLYEIELWYAWEGLYFSDRYNGGGPTNLPADAVTFDERTRGGTDFGNGDGLLVYPGPLPSVRLKALRRGLSDRLLLTALERCGGREAAQRIARRVVPRALGEASGRRAWSDDERIWESARAEVVTSLVRECGDV